jgi:hypothetical protein
MVGAWVDVDFDARTCGNADSLLPSVELVAANVAAAHVAYKAIVLPILRLTNCRPGRVAVDDGQSVFKESASAVAYKIFRG